MEDSFLWFGYKLINGALHVKRYYNPDDLKETIDCPDVDEIFGPFHADTRDEASLKLHHLSAEGDAA